MSRRRFFLSSKEIKGDKALLKGEEHHHLARVMRLKAGDQVFLFTEKEEEFQAQIVEIRRKKSLLIIKKKLKAKGFEPSLKIILLQGIARGSRMDLIVQKANELGAEAIIPLMTGRSLHPRNPAEKQRRWQKISLQAAKQCGRLRGAKIFLPTALKELDLNQLPKLKLILSEQGGRGLKEVLKKPYDEIALMVGAEGGWAEEEIQWAINNGFAHISLGNRILRTETASLAVLSILQYQWGDMG